jgi:hypothetical protein
MNTAELEKNAEILKKQGKLWRDPASRQRFEQETGLMPIVTGNSPEVEAQHQTGATKEYHDRFHEWALKQ